MNRPIKFRAWDKIKNKWLDLYRIVFATNGAVLAVEDLDGEQYGLHQVELMQYTCLLDKNGKEIYEGDIVSLNGNISADNSMGILPNGWDFDEDDIYEVVWDAARTGYKLQMNEVPGKEVQEEFGQYAKAYMQKYLSHARGLLLQGNSEVIGNVFENPELLPNNPSK